MVKVNGTAILPFLTGRLPDGVRNIFPSLAGTVH